MLVGNVAQRKISGFFVFRAKKLYLELENTIYVDVNSAMQPFTMRSSACEWLFYLNQGKNNGNDI